MELIEGDHELNPENRNKNFSFHSFIILITHGFTSSKYFISLPQRDRLEHKGASFILYAATRFRVHYNETKQGHITI